MSNEAFIPYGRQLIDEGDISAVVDVLRGDWLTTGPAVEAFETAFADYVDARHAVAVANGTAALHLAMLAAGIGPGDEVIVPANTFVASANAVRFVGADVRFADIDADTLLIDVDSARSLVTSRTRAIVPVDYGGMPCDYDALKALAREHDLLIIEDACHAPGAVYQEQRVGSIADMTAFSFHPVKHIATGEGGMVTTQSSEFSERLKMFRGHGITNDFRKREAAGTWEMDQVELGFNYRISDINCALGLSQLSKQGPWVERRRAIAEKYRQELSGEPRIRLQSEPSDRQSSWHLYPIRLVGEDSAELRKSVFATMRAAGIGVNVHYRPVYLNSYYQRLGFERGLCPRAEEAYDGLLSLPMWPGLDSAAQDRVIATLRNAIS